MYVGVCVCVFVLTHKTFYIQEPLSVRIVYTYCLVNIK